jgi:lipopolysaccharide biosynthesis glycosyltransferase
MNSYIKKKENIIKNLKHSIVGFVFDKSYFNKDYIRNHFNQSHPVVISAMKVRELDIFFNGGVALINSKQWRLNNLTTLAEELIKENANGKVYSTSVGDQGITIKTNIIMYNIIFFY